MAITLSLLENLEYVYDLILFACFFIAIMEYKVYEKTLRIVCWLLIITFLYEMLILCIHPYLKSKSYAFHLFIILDLTMYVYYFLFFIFERVSKLVLVLVPLGCILIELLNLTFFQPWNTLNTNTLMFECVICIGMSLYALFALLKSETVKISYYPYFIIWSSILVLMTGTFFFWACYGIFKPLIKANESYKNLLCFIQLTINILSYSGICAGLLLYSKKMMK
jgi:hypothetical protein